MFNEENTVEQMLFNPLCISITSTQVADTLQYTKLHRFLQ